MQHVFHLHGGSFYVVGSTPGIGLQSLDTIRKLNIQDRLVEKNLKDPLLKDTISVPPSGVVVIRFRADNPGKLLNTIELVIIEKVQVPNHQKWSYCIIYVHIYSVLKSFNLLTT